MKKRTVIEIVFIIIFIAAGWYMFDVMKRIESSHPELVRQIENNNKLGFMGGTGIDTMGHVIESAVVNGSDETRRRYIAGFLLRNNSLDSDVKFWNEVNNHLSELDTVSVNLTAYCENDRCIDTIKKNPGIAHFSVMEYGGVVDMQAILNADADGEFWLSGKGLRKIKWRDGVQAPIDIAVEMEQ